MVIDLRHNGGGSLTEAINLTGLFIDNGPVVQVKDSDGQKTQYDDTERGVAWDGPLVVLTSKFSASASEIFAGAIQDYNRGLIVGDDSTHGKGTVQSLLDLGQQLFRGIAERSAAGRSEDHDAAVLSPQRRQHAEPRRAGRRRAALADQPARRGRVEPRLRHEVRQGRPGRVSPSTTWSTPRLIDELRKTRRPSGCTESKDFQKVLRDIDRFNEQKERKTISLNEEKFMADKAELTAEKQEEKEFEELNDPNRPVVKRDYYFNEVLDITTDYAKMLSGSRKPRP